MISEEILRKEYQTSNYEEFLAKNGLDTKVWDIKLSEKQISQIEGQINKIEEERSSWNPLTQKDKKFYYDLMTKTKIKESGYKLNLLLETYNSCFNYTLNKIHNLEKEFVDKKKKNLSQKERLGYKNFIFAKQNLEWAKAYFEEFKDTGIFKHLDTACRLLQSVNNKFLLMKCSNCGNEETKSKFTSKNRFCSYSNDDIIRDIRFELIETIKWYSQVENKDIAFLTLTLPNVYHIDKDQIKSIQKIIKEFLRYRFKEEDIRDIAEKRYSIDSSKFKHLIGKRICDVFPGYYGTLEIVTHEKGSKRKDGSIRELDEFNLHFHYLMLREKDKEKGYIPQYYLTEAWKSVSKKFGDGEFKNAQILDIAATHLNKKGDKFINAVSYILQYVSKGMKIANLEHRRQVIKATEGIRIRRSGGLLSKRNINDVKVLKDLDKNSDKIKENNINYNKPWKKYKEEVLKTKRCNCYFCGSQTLQYDSLSHDELITDYSDPTNLKVLTYNVGAHDISRNIDLDSEDNFIQNLFSYSPKSKVRPQGFEP